MVLDLDAGSNTNTTNFAFPRKSTSATETEDSLHYKKLAASRGTAYTITSTDLRNR